MLTPLLLARTLKVMMILRLMTMSTTVLMTTNDYAAGDRDDVLFFLAGIVGPDAPEAA